MTYIHVAMLEETQINVTSDDHHKKVLVIFILR